MTLDQCDGHIVGLEEGRVCFIVNDAKMAGTTLEDAGVDARAGLVVESIPPQMIEFSLEKLCTTCAKNITLRLKMGASAWESEELCEGCAAGGTEQT